jgi:ubiquinone/menaquinone biosynthesis C-methylase UbiE
MDENVDRSDMLRLGYNKTAPMYDLQYRDFQFPKYKAALELMPVEMSSLGKVLDHGCGTGLFYHYLQKKQSMPGELVGLDFSEGMLEMARARGMNCVTGVIEDLPFGDSEFDALFSFTVLQVIAQDEKRIIEEMVRVVTDGGFVVLSVLISSREQQLGNMLTSAGLSIITEEYAGQDRIYFCEK